MGKPRKAHHPLLMFFLKTVRDGINMRILISCVMDANPVWMPWMLIAEHAMYKEDSFYRSLAKAQKKAKQVLNDYINENNSKWT